MSRAYVSEIWTVGDFTFSQVRNHGFSDYEGRPLYRFQIAGGHTGVELYTSLDHAMVAAVGERHTGARSASGSGTDTAAGWFMKMIGAPTD